MKRLLLILTLFLVSCKEPVDYLNADLKSENGYYQAVIEIPAGTNLKLEYDKALKEFRPSLRDGKERTINFLAYPANYGFIPSTFSDPAKGGDGDALDVMVISSSIASGELIEIIPIGMIKLIDAGEQDFKIIAIPVEESQKRINVKNFKDFDRNYKAAKEILETWFLHYDPMDSSEILGWGDEKETIAEIEKARIDRSP